jgi:hypothetical protein
MIKLSLTGLISIVAVCVYVNTNSQQTDNSKHAKPSETVALTAPDINPLAQNQTLTEIENNESILHQKYIESQRQSEFILSAASVIYPHEVNDIAMRAMHTFDRDGNGKLSKAEAPFMLYLADRFLPVDITPPTLLSDDYKMLSEQLRGTAEAEMRSVEQLRDAQSKLDSLNEQIAEEIQSTAFKELSIQQVYDTLLIAYAWSDIDSDGKLMKALDFPFLSCASDFLLNEDNLDY